MKKISTVIALFMMFSSQAQSLKIGGEVGLSSSVSQIKFVGYATSKETINNRIGARFGCPIQYSLTSCFKLNSGLFYAMKGDANYPENNANIYYKQTINISYSTLELPLCMIYTKPIVKDNSFFIGIGPYFGYGLNGNLRYYYPDGERAKQNVSWGNVDGENQIKHWEWGIQMQAGLIYKNGLFLRITAQRQLNNIAASKLIYCWVGDIRATFPTIQNQIYTSISIGYFLKHKYKK